jgi:hypothetical protein
MGRFAKLSARLSEMRMVCELLTCCTSSSVGPPSGRRRGNLSWPKGSPCPPKARPYQTGLVQEGEIKSHRAAYDDGIQSLHSVPPLHLTTSPVLSRQGAAEGYAKSTPRTAYQVVRLVQEVFAIAGRRFRRCFRITEQMFGAQ